MGELLGVVEVFVFCKTAVHRLPQQVSQRQMCVFLLREWVRCCLRNSLNPSHSSNSRTRNKPPSEVTRDPWKLTFKEALNES